MANQRKTSGGGLRGPLKGNLRRCVAFKTITDKNGVKRKVCKTYSPSAYRRTKPPVAIRSKSYRYRSPDHLTKPRKGAGGRAATCIKFKTVTRADGTKTKRCAQFGRASAKATRKRGAAAPRTASGAYKGVTRDQLINRLKNAQKKLRELRKRS